MTLSHLQGHSYCKPFKWDFDVHDAMLVRYLLSLRVCPPSVRPFVTSRCTTKTTKCRISEHLRKIAQRIQFYDAKDLYEIPIGSSVNGGAKLRLLTGREVFGSDLPRKFVSITHGGSRPRRCAGGGRRGVINNFGDSRTVDDTYAYLCM